MYTVKKVSEGDFESFLNLPSRIYRKSEIMQKRSDEEALLKGTHTLSKYFSSLSITIGQVIPPAPSINK